MDIKNYTEAEKERLLDELLADKKERDNKKRDAYEGIRAQMVEKVSERVKGVTEEVKGLFQFVTGETSAFYDIMKTYGQLRRDGQLSYKIVEGNFCIEVKTNKVKKFDERANIAAARLIDFLQEYIASSERGTEDAMYQLAMTLLERNQHGDLDYKSISKLYDLESKFNSTEYSDIMALFKESNVIEGTATNFYFSEKDNKGVWRKIEPNFNRM